jgi:predicted kinase
VTPTGEGPAATPIFLVVGGPGVGKSSTSRALAATFPRSVHVPVDDLRAMVVTGLVLPGPDWSDELRRQVRVARAAAVAMAVDHAAAGYVAVVDDFWDPFELAEYRELLARPETIAVLLHPDEAEARRRNSKRSPGEAGAYVDGAIPLVYAMLAPVIERLADEGWLVLDTTHLDVADAVDAIRARAGLAPARPPAGGEPARG